MSLFSPNICGNVVLNAGAACTAGKPILPTGRRIPNLSVCRHLVLTDAVSVDESKYSLCLIACDTLLYPQHIAVEVWTTAEKSHQKHVTTHITHHFLFIIFHTLYYQ